MDTACSLGFCAEHAAIAEMLKARESAVQMIVAVNKDGIILPPCGRCPELLWQVDEHNQRAWVPICDDFDCRNIRPVFGPMLWNYPAKC